jgi:hypothetical protein
MEVRCCICQETIKPGDFLVSMVDSVALLGVTTIGVHFRCAIASTEMALPGHRESKQALEDKD